MRRPTDALFTRIGRHLPAEFKILHQQFLLRVVDLEALSIEADIPRFLGQFAGVLIMFSLCLAIGVLWFPPSPTQAWSYEQSRISDVLFVVGLCSVLMWDTTFPDRRDVMVLGPLPVRPRIILSAKISASAAVLGIAVIALNCASSWGLSVVFGAPTGHFLGIPRFFIAYWLSIIAAGIFLYGTILTVQGFTALVLPRRVFLRTSAVLQLAAFASFLSARFLQPDFITHAETASPEHHWLLSISPTFWFAGLLSQLNGSLPNDLLWLAHRAWFSLAIAFLGSAVSLLLCYLRTMKKTIEDPDLVPGTGGWQWFPRFGSSLQNTIVVFCLRSIARSRQHRVALAFFWSIVFAITLAWTRHLMITASEPISMDFIMSTVTIMVFAVLGLRSVFALPISLNANWMLRITQLHPTRDYISATRRALIVFGLIPALAISAVLSIHLRPWHHAAEHIGFLALFGGVLVELGLIRFDKVPFTCSYLPGKTNIQAIFCGFAFIFIVLGILLGTFELDALSHPSKYFVLVAIVSSTILALHIVNRLHARSAVLYFEEMPPEIITRLGLIYVPPSQSPSAGASTQ